MKKLLMELLGTFFFVLTIVATGNPLAIAAMLMAWVYIGGYISGAHYNPMVTLAMIIRRHPKSTQLWWYMPAQILGGFLAFAAAAQFGAEIMIPAPGVSVVNGFIIEALLAFILALVILVVATSERFKNSHIFGFAIGFTIPALAALGATSTGGLFNPAIALGASIFGFMNGVPMAMEHLVMYVGGAFAGGALAAYAFDFFFDEK